MRQLARSTHDQHIRDYYYRTAAIIMRAAHQIQRDTAHKRISALINQAWGTSGMPIHIVDSPHSSGAMMWRDNTRWVYRTGSGEIINHPGAYSKRGWSNMHYCASSRGLYVTRRIYDRLLSLGDYASIYLAGIIESSGRLSFGGD